MNISRAVGSPKLVDSSYNLLLPEQFVEEGRFALVPPEKPTYNRMERSLVHGTHLLTQRIEMLDEGLMSEGDSSSVKNQSSNEALVSAIGSFVKKAFSLKNMGVVGAGLGASLLLGVPASVVLPAVIIGGGVIKMAGDTQILQSGVLALERQLPDFEEVQNAQDSYQEKLRVYKILKRYFGKGNISLEQLLSSNEAMETGINNLRLCYELLRSNLESATRKTDKKIDEIIQAMNQVALALSLDLTIDGSIPLKTREIEVVMSQINLFISEIINKEPGFEDRLVKRGNELLELLQQRQEQVKEHKRLTQILSQTIPELKSQLKAILDEKNRAMSTVQSVNAAYFALGDAGEGVEALIDENTELQKILSKAATLIEDFSLALGARNEIASLERNQEVEDGSGR